MHPTLARNVHTSAIKQVTNTRGNEILKYLSKNTNSKYITQHKNEKRA